MDVLLDTNAIRAVGLESPAIRSLSDYLERTGSTLLLPHVVLQELVAQRRAVVEKVRRDLEQAHRDLARLEPTRPTTAPVVDAHSIIERYREAVLKLHPRTNVLRNEPEDLDELVRRLANRIPPASADGEEARDVLIWLAAKRRSAVAPLALVSRDKGIVDSGGLRRELLSEIAAEGTPTIVAYPTLDAFLAQHHARTSFVTAAWLHDQVGTQNCLDALDEFLDDHEHIFRRDVEELGEPTGYQCPIQLVQHEIQDFVVADLPDGGLYVSVTLWTELELEVEYNERLHNSIYEFDEIGPAYSQCIYPEAVISLQLGVADRAVVSVSVTAVAHA